MLHGNVESYFEKAHAEERVEKVPGVEEIENKIRVEGEGGDNVMVDYWKPYPLSFGDAPEPEDLKNEIEQQLWWSPFVDENEITIEVQGKKAILSGQVETYKEKQEAMRSAFEAGASEVENNIRVGYVIKEES